MEKASGSRPSDQTVHNTAAIYIYIYINSIGTRNYGKD